MKKRICSFVIAFVLAVSLMATSVSAAPCPISVSGKICGSAMFTEYQGSSNISSAKHYYGGFLGLFEKVCNYEYYIKFYAIKCTSGHTLGSDNQRWETGHDCH